jgi:hypothetical protein
MIKMKRDHIALIIILVITLIAGCSSIRNIPKQHEEKLTEKPLCLDCHEEGETVGNRPFSVYSHNASFFERHGNPAGDFQAVCETCHSRKFCSDCHGVKEEIVPSRKLGNRPDRSSPHRGDYFNKHKIEGRVDKAKCFKCHGRRNNKACRQCH